MSGIPPQQNDGISAVEKSLEAVDGGTMPMMGAAPPMERLYKLDPKSKIPVSKTEGKVWESRIKASSKVVSSLKEMWDEAESYYSNSQAAHRKDTEGNSAGGRAFANNRRDSFSVTENIVYATVNAVIPSIYAKNPDIEVTMFDPTMQPVGTVLENLGDRLAAMKYAPGLNLKAKIRKSIVRCEITNEAWVLVGYTKKEFSSDQARADIETLGQELLKAEDPKQIEEIEGKLMALEEVTDLLDPPGPFVRSIRGEDVRIDSASVEDDFSDANWKAVRLTFPTVYLNAKYRQKDKEGNYVSAYKATHVVDARPEDTGVDQTQRDIDNFKIFEKGEENPAAYGYTDKRAFDKAKRTECWAIFDKVKRRFMLYAANDWTWPIWVMDDPYGLPNFYPIHRLQYHTDPRANRTKGEVSNYLDQQDIINTSQDELNRLRTLVRDNLIFDSNSIDAKDVETIMLNSNKKMHGVKFPEGKKLEDIINAPPTPTLQFQHLWDTSSAMRAINMISGVQDALRGEQFKTNTTNKAIEEYSSIASVRLDEKRDAVEDFIGAIMYDILFMCLRFMDMQTVMEIVGAAYQQIVEQTWKPMDPREIRSFMLCSVVGGSSQKPTSAAKKAEALQVGQILGQFASASPAVLITVLKVFERSFDGIVMTDTNWQQLNESIMMQLQRGNSEGGEGSQGGEDETGEGEKEPDQDEELENSPEFKSALDQAVAKGVPKEKARAMIKVKIKENANG